MKLDATVHGEKHRSLGYIAARSVHSGASFEEYMRKILSAIRSMGLDESPGLIENIEKKWHDHTPRKSA